MRSPTLKLIVGPCFLSEASTYVLSPHAEPNGGGRRLPRAHAGVARAVRADGPRRRLRVPRQVDAHLAPLEFGIAPHVVVVAIVAVGAGVGAVRHREEFHSRAPYRTSRNRHTFIPSRYAL